MSKIKSTGKQTSSSILTQSAIHPSWLPLLQQALQEVNPLYLQTLQENTVWLPGINNIFNAFSLPLDKTHYILFGESPYPRAASANGYAFWDGAVGSLWSATGFSREVNRATSLRNLLKMLLLTRGDLSPDNLSQPAIAQLDKSHYVQTGAELFNNFLKHGFLLLNASLVFHSAAKVKADAKEWLKFINTLLIQLKSYRPQLVLLGNIAKTITHLPSAQKFDKFIAEHPFNLSFIHNLKVQEFFLPFNLLAITNKL